MRVKLTIIGCGDAFCAGGRLQSAYLLEAGGEPLLVDCGMTTLMGLERMGISLDSIPRIVISHLHGDHFGGLVMCLMHAALVTRRTTPIDVYGPPGTEARTMATMELLYPGMAAKLGSLQVRYHDVHAGQALQLGKTKMIAFTVDHPSGAPSYALRFETGGKVFAYSGDSQWTEAIVDVGHKADLYLLECYKFEGTPVFHLSWVMIQQHLARIAAKRIVLTHMSNDMLARQGEVKDPSVAFAEDGAVYEI